MQQPAYNAVSARTTLARPPVASTEAMAPAKTGPSAFGVNVRNYAARSMDKANAIPGISSQEVMVKLKEIITYYTERGFNDAEFWETYPLPQTLIRAERSNVLAAAALSSPPPGLTNLPLNTHTTPKKRKSQDMDELQGRPAEENIPPWRKTNLADRIEYGNGRHDKRQKKNALAGNAIDKADRADLEKRKQRFNLNQPANKANDSDSDMNIEPVIGTNQQLEKQYFRLTAPPKPETVRPLHVLEKTLAMLTKKWKSEKNYNYICNQFKSLRQDLTVQHIKNAFTVKVYEIHARIALEKGDLGEYNQCQTQLKGLYSQKLGGNPAEFTAYRILYFVYTCNKTDMNDLLAELTPADKVHPWMKHALDVRSSLALGNYHKFFRLYLDAPNMGGYLMDMFVDRERFHALANIGKAYIHVTLRFLADELGFEGDNACREFLEAQNAQNILEEKADPDSRLQWRVKVREGAGLFENLRASAFSKVDIKGQI